MKPGFYSTKVDLLQCAACWNPAAALLLAALLLACQAVACQSIKLRLQQHGPMHLSSLHHDNSFHIRYHRQLVSIFIRQRMLYSWNGFLREDSAAP